MMAILQVHVSMCLVPHICENKHTNIDMNRKASYCLSLLKNKVIQILQFFAHGTQKVNGFTISKLFHVFSKNYEF